MIEGGLVWVAEETGRLVGLLAAQTAPDRRPDTLHVLELAVAGPWQGRGLGRALMTATIAEARARRLSAITLTTFRDVAWNAPFYGRLGFRILETGEIDDRLAAFLANEARRGLQGRCAMRLLL